MYRRRRAVLADGDAARPRPRAAVRDRLDQRERVERGVRVQRHRPARRQVARTAGHRLRAGPPLPRGDAVRARPDPDRPALPHAPARADRAAVRRAARAGAAGRAAAGRARAALHAAHRRRAARETAAHEATDSDGDGAPGRRMRLAVAAGLALWMLTGIVLFSHMARLHPRYVEGFMPAVAAMLGIGVAWAGVGATRVRLIALVSGAGGERLYVERCCTGGRGCGGSRSRARSARSRSRRSRASARTQTPARARWPCGGDARADADRRCGALPMSADITAIDNGVTDAGYVGALPARRAAPGQRLSARPPGRRPLRGRRPSRRRRSAR